MKLTVNNRYILNKILGDGTFSTVWEGWDKKQKRIVAVKVQKSGKDNHQAAQDEIKILLKLNQANKVDTSVIKLKSNFSTKIFGKKHYCMVFDKYGDNLYSLFKYLNKNQKKLPLNIVKFMTRQIFKGLHFTHSNNVIHTDIKPENILLRKKIDDINFDNFNEEDFNIVIIDYGTACWKDEHFSDYVQTMEYRAPECILGDGDYYDEKIDIWSAACVIFELITLCTLFSLSSNPIIHINNTYDDSDSDSVQSTGDRDSDSVQSTGDSDSDSDSSSLNLLRCRRQRSKGGRYPPVQSRGKDDEKDKDKGEKHEEDESDSEDESFNDTLRESSESSFGSDDDEEEDELLMFLHLFKIQSALGPLPKYSYQKFPHYKEYYTTDGYLKYFHPDTIPHRSLRVILQKDYQFSKNQAKKIEQFMLPLLALKPTQRSSANDALKSKWLS